ncbi:unnamed protein product [Sphenostylis stenocarpa]|uniref:Uncharacterized protein n=1 Tax=Sphenostylis stenocarpa TaxID=92480 RepID=A0AA86W021_9FABA|nr:unnamed protein product [Sphenostylis stenocarpa]
MSKGELKGSFNIELSAVLTNLRRNFSQITWFVERWLFERIPCEPALFIKA